MFSVRNVQSVSHKHWGETLLTVRTVSLSSLCSLFFLFVCSLGGQPRGDAQLDQGSLRGHSGPAGAWEVCRYSMYLALHYNTHITKVGFKSLKNLTGYTNLDTSNVQLRSDLRLDLHVQNLRLTEWRGGTRRTVHETYLCCFTHVISWFMFQFLALIQQQATEMQRKSFFEIILNRCRVAETVVWQCVSDEFAL